MTHHKVTGGGGVQLHVIETGKLTGRPILFIHGFSQCSLAWSRQLHSELAQEYRLVAMDLRGHGLSDKPRDAYSNSHMWADDVRAAIETLHLEQPVVCGWSYGPLVVLDYIRHYGDDAIGGICLVGGVTKLGSEDAIAVLTPEFLGLIPGFFATDVESCIGSLRSLLDLCFEDLGAEDLYTMLGFSVSVPPYVRQGLFSRSFDNNDLLREIRKPVLIVHGSSDRVVKPAAAEEHRARFRNPRVELVPGGGHGLFRDDAARFNAMLDSFAQTLAPERLGISGSA